MDGMNACAPTTTSTMFMFESGVLMVDSVGVPFHATGPFPNALNPNSVCTQVISKSIPLRAGTNIEAAVKTTTPLGAIGVALNGVVLLNPSAANGTPAGYSRPEGFNFNAGSVASLFGEDEAGGHPNQVRRLSPHPPSHHHHTHPLIHTRWLFV
jgi:hypothetical protein